jgi:hypothetical protein
MRPSSITAWTAEDSTPNVAQYQHLINKIPLLRNTSKPAYAMKKNIGSVSLKKFHPCAGAMLIFSVSFQVDQ